MPFTSLSPNHSSLGASWGKGDSHPHGEASESRIPPAAGQAGQARVGWNGPHDHSASSPIIGPFYSFHQGPR